MGNECIDAELHLHHQKTQYKSHLDMCLVPSLVHVLGIVDQFVESPDHCIYQHIYPEVCEADEGSV